MPLDDKDHSPFFVRQPIDRPGVPDSVRAQPTRCLKCQQRTIRLRTRPGRTIQFRNMAGLPVPDEIRIPTCSRCHAEYLDAETTARLDAILVETYRNVLRARVRLAIDLITEHISQRRLELLIGLSQGYISRLRAGQGNPSPELVSHLALIAYDPPGRLSELERFWAHPEGFTMDMFARH